MALFLDYRITFPLYPSEKESQNFEKFESSEKKRIMKISINI